jgi:hypothetical protein
MSQAVLLNKHLCEFLPVNKMIGVRKWRDGKKSTENGVSKAIKKNACE